MMNRMEYNLLEQKRKEFREAYLKMASRYDGYTRSILIDKMRSVLDIYDKVFEMNKGFTVLIPENCDRGKGDVVIVHGEPIFCCHKHQTEYLKAVTG